MEGPQSSQIKDHVQTSEFLQYKFSTVYDRLVDLNHSATQLNLAISHLTGAWDDVSSGLKFTSRGPVLHSEVVPVCDVGGSSSVNPPNETSQCSIDKGDSEHQNQPIFPGTLDAHSATEPGQNTIDIHVKSVPPENGKVHTKVGGILHLRNVWNGCDAETLERVALQIAMRVNRVGSEATLYSDQDEELVANVGKNTLCPIVHPGRLSRIMWVSLCLALIAWDLLVLPLTVFDTLESTGFVVIEWFCTVTWTIDIFFNFRTGYYVGARLEMRPHIIARHYLMTWFPLDLFIVSLEWVTCVASVALPVSLVRTIRTYRIIRVLKLLKLIRLSKMQTLWLRIKELINSNIFYLVFKTVVMTLFLLVSLHLVACAWYGIGTSEADGWASYEEYEGEKAAPFWYMASQRWVIAQLNGRTDMNPKRNMFERGFTCFIGISLGVILKALFTSMLTKTILELSQLQSEKSRRHNLVNEYLASHSLSTVLVTTVKRFLHEYQEPDFEYKKEKQVLSFLPLHVQSDLLLEVRSPRLTKHSFFCAISLETPRTLRRICAAMKLVSALTFEVIFEKGDPCYRMLFVDKGKLTYGEPLSGSVSSDFKDFVEEFGWTTQFVLGPGRWVSEAALWAEWFNYGRLVADYYICFYALQATDFANAVKDDTGEYARAVLYARRFIQQVALQEELSDILDFEIVAAGKAKTAAVNEPSVSRPIPFLGDESWPLDS